MLERFAVIGNPVMHSLSPRIHQLFAKQTGTHLIYETIEGDLLQFESQVSAFFSQDGKGLNVTLPFKQRAFALADSATKRCEQAGAANTLWINNHKLCADNTDGIGFIRDVTRYAALEGKNILILGAGGAARGIIHPLLEQNPRCLAVANRTQDKLVELQRDFPDVHTVRLEDVVDRYDLIINATSAGLYQESIALSPAVFAQQPFCYDLSYRLMAVTPFVEYAKSQGCPSVDGLGMLVEQAAEAFLIWYGIMPATDTVLASLRQKKR